MEREVKTRPVGKVRGQQGGMEEVGEQAGANNCGRKRKVYKVDD